MNVLDFPIWKDHHRRISKRFEVRANANVACIVYREGSAVWHVDISRGQFTAKNVKTCLQNLAGTILEGKFPGTYISFIEDEERVVNGVLSRENMKTKYWAAREWLVRSGLGKSLFAA